jgi:maltose alpha-D-glucosyltransferase/alpha-amylase
VWAIPTSAQQAHDLRRCRALQGLGSRRPGAHWHRLQHQPDLNYDNPAVVHEMLAVLDFWLDLGVDGFRLDAVPYLVERDHTGCENLPETHALIKAIRAHIDARAPGRMLLAEANQLPAEVRAYFGDGDECHMAYHFPVMPRIFMALHLEDRQPISDVMERTPPIPDNCQWALFLRNHDELTLEMVTDEERDYMYLAYASPQARLNPAFAGAWRHREQQSAADRAPGWPALFVARDADRLLRRRNQDGRQSLSRRSNASTPMQWTNDRNAGFSRADPARLYSPVIMDAVYGYPAVNVEAQESDAASLLHWMRNMIRLRKLFKVFGRGTMEFLSPSNRKVLAYVRRYREDVILCVANLSRTVQPAELELSAAPVSHRSRCSVIRSFRRLERRRTF